MLRPLRPLRVYSMATAVVMALAVPSYARGEQLLMLAEFCTDPSMDAADIVENLVSDGWAIVPEEEYESAARSLADGALLAGRVSTTRETLADMREAGFARSLSMVTRKTSDYFSSTTLRSEDATNVANIFWSKQGNRLKCFAATTRRNDASALATQIKSMTATGRIVDAGPSWNARSTTDRENPRRISLSILKQDVLALFSTDPLAATVGMFAEYFPRKG